MENTINNDSNQEKIISTNVDTISTYPSGTAIGQDVSTQTPTTSPTTGATPIGGTTLIERPLTRDIALEEANRQKMLDSGQLLETDNATLAQQKVNLFTYGTEEPIWGATDSSASAASQVNDAMSGVGGGLANTNALLAESSQRLNELKLPEYKLYQDFASEIEKSRTQGADLYEQVKKQIEADYAERRIEQEDSNRALVGSSTRLLASFGALGRTGSGLDYLKGVQVRNEREINKLLNQKNALLLEATKAYQEQDWNKLKQKIAESKAITDQYNQVQQWQFEDAMKSNDQLMEQARFGWDAENRASGKLAMLSSTGIPFDKIPKTDIANFASQMGVSVAVVESLYNIDQKSAQTKAIAEQAKFDKEIFGIIKEIPAGVTVKIGNNYYTGIKSALGDRAGTIVTDGATNNQYLLADVPVSEEYPDGIKKIDLEIKGKNAPSSYTPAQRLALSSSISSAYADGTIGGQCGTFVRNLVNWPEGLNTLAQKMTQINPTIGVGKGQYPPEVGYVIISGDQNNKNTSYGHVAVINKVQPTGDGNYILTLTESNYNLDEKVSNTRQINTADPSIVGYFDAIPKSQFISGAKDLKDESVLVDISQFTPDMYNQVTSKFEQFKGADGKVNTEVYTQLYNFFVNTYKNGAKSFIERFPPSKWLNREYDVNRFFFQLAQ